MTAKEEFEKWFIENRPPDWYAAEREKPMDAFDRVRLHDFARAAYLEATKATAQRCMELAHKSNPDERIKEEFDL